MEKKTDYQCPECFGTGKLECKKCGGTGKITCPECKANAHYKCDKCKGYGYFYGYSLGLVPFKKTAAVIPNLFFKTDVKGLDYRLSNVMNQVETIKIQDVKKLNEKDVVALLGYELDSDAKKMLGQAKKTFEKLEKSDLDKPIRPVHVFPVLELDVETPKGKKFKLFSIGSENGYSVFDHGFS